MRYILGLTALTSSVVVAIASCGGSTGDSDSSNTTGNHFGGHNSGSTGSGAGKGSSGGDDVGGSSGVGIILDDGGNGDGANCATATTCQAQGAECGSISDGCDGLLQCGDCGAEMVCGADNKCGKPPCTSKSCADQGFTCGMNGDGCGNLLDCGTCDNGDTCGGGGTASQCGHITVCTPKTCADQGFTCGMNGDTCGGALDCGGCTLPATCGGGGVDNQCGIPPCVPKTCAQLGANCGPVADGCGALLQCGTCNQPETCGGQTASVCGTPASCTNLCLQQVTCADPAVTTTLSGIVYAPNGTDPLPSALVYVPNGTVTPFAANVSCDKCGAEASGSPLVSAVTGVDGKFTIKNAPVGANIPLVIQIGRWRRQVTISNVGMCVDNTVPQALTRLPKNKGEGDIPHMAFATGSVDSLECVVRKIGVDDAEFTGPGGTGRIHLYVGANSGGAHSGTDTTSETALVTSFDTLKPYDMVLFPCQSAAYSRTTTQQQAVIDYTSAGGRVFATHFTYTYLYNDAPFKSTAAWHVNQADPNDQTGFIDMTFPKGLALAQWLKNVGASTTLGQIPINVIRHDYDSVVSPSQNWMTIKNPAAPVHYTFNTPVGSAAADQCGRVLFSDFHVENASSNGGKKFPAECPAAGTAMTPQEKLLEYMLFDLGSCVTPDQPTCTPKTCADLGQGCGPAGDGCGGTLDCGTCDPTQLCTGSPSVCVTPSCTPKTCAGLGYNCGPAGDGCGNEIMCGDCPQGQTCGGGGKPGVCGNQQCTPKSCTDLGISCGPAGDGCGGLLQCGTCNAPQTCGGGNKANVCGGGGPA